jgi:hypothetical protein
MALVKAQFTVDAVEAFEGWHDPNVRWNGFACPFFERVEADRVAAAFGLRYAEVDDTYRDATDTYTGRLQDGLHLYAIGTEGWTWLDVEDSLEPEF